MLRVIALHGVTPTQTFSPFIYANQAVCIKKWSWAPPDEIIDFGCCVIKRENLNQIFPLPFFLFVVGSRKENEKEIRTSFFMTLTTCSFLYKIPGLLHYFKKPALSQLDSPCSWHFTWWSSWDISVSVAPPKAKYMKYPAASGGAIQLENVGSRTHFFWEN